MMDITWLKPWEPVDQNCKDVPGLIAELRKELAPTHRLFGISVAVLGRRWDCDDVLFQLLDESHRVAVVHLTWIGRTESGPVCPGTFIYSNVADWIERCLKPDHEFWLSRNGG